jgi:hypothetical protein
MSGLDVDAVLVRRFLGELDMWGLSVSGRRHSREALYYTKDGPCGPSTHFTESVTPTCSMSGLWCAVRCAA